MHIREQRASFSETAIRFEFEDYVTQRNATDMCRVDRSDNGISRDRRRGTADNEKKTMTYDTEYSRHIYDIRQQQS